ncbi:type I restriction enzyme S subunit [Rhodococcus rhodochrous J38]|uniref:restriction endonuclease subunit S n=1 Tax=Rhodococcus rhodochrous TaxID=1829 RepID=UPI0011A5505A|nr:restriction endonuclease subunit S [Rhodococcus rhodochrous]TWH41278.1 type I restriction enzyme S subunit [Rhodococcus rhodochrous J38]
MTERKLPPGWVWTTLGDVAEYVNGRGFKKSEWGLAGRPIIRIQNLTGSGSTFNYYSGEVLPKHVVKPNDLLVSWAATLSVHRWTEAREGALNQHIFKVTPSDAIDSRFLEHSLRFAINDMYESAHGSGMVHVTRGKFESTEIPLPPLPEQHRIVDALEDHLSRLEAAELTLSQAKVRVANLRGKTINFSHGIATSTADSALPPTEAEVVDGDLPHLPSSWSWRRLGELAEVVGGITKDAKKQSDDSFPLHPYLRVANVQAGYLDLDHITEIRATPKQVEKLTLREGDVLLNEGGDRDKLGRGWIWENQIPNCLHQNHVFRARADQKEIDPRLIAWHANSFGRSWFMRNGKQSVNLASVSLKTIKAFPVPVPPPEDQESIVESITTALESQSRLQSAIDVALARSSALRHSLLRAAFNGELVDQDPTDEPADVALAKIRDQQSGTVPRRRRKKVATD